MRPGTTTCTNGSSDDPGRSRHSGPPLPNPPPPGGREPTTTGGSVMSASAMIPRQASIAINDLLDNCARIEPGQHVLIVAALDGLHGGENIVDEQAIAWVQAGVQQRGAYANILWLDMPTRPARIVDASGKIEGWRLPPILKAALSSADVFINHCVDLSFEEELKEVPELLAEYKVPMVRNKIGRA